MPRALAALTLAALLSPAAEASPSLAHLARTALAPVRFAGGRLADLADAVELNVGSGRGFKIELCYGIHFFGLGDVRAWRAGTLDHRVGYWRELDSELSLFPFSVLGWPVSGAARLAGDRRRAQDARFVATAGGLGVEYLDRKDYLGDPAFLLKDTVEGWRHTRLRDSFPIGLELYAWRAGARFRLRPLQLADFFAGFVGIDLSPWLEKTPF